MRSILQKKGLRFIFAANVISMIGSGMNSAAVAWYILQATHSEIALGTFAVVQTLPAILLLPFTGVIIDREDRRRLVMVLDAARAVVIAAVAVLAFEGKAKVWELYAMNMLVAAGFWMFWPTITALIQEMTPDDEFIHANTFLLAGVQGGWLIAGALVGFVYNKIGLGGVLLLDVGSYVLSFVCYFAVRKGRHVVPRPAELHADIVAAEGAVQKFFRELRDGIHFLRGHREIVLLGVSWALYLWYRLSPHTLTAAEFETVFPILAWQLLFVHGLVIGYHRERIGAFIGARRKPLTIAAGAATSGFIAFALCNPWTEGPRLLHLHLLPTALRKRPNRTAAGAAWPFWSCSWADWAGRPGISPRASPRWRRTWSCRATSTTSKTGAAIIIRTALRFGWPAAA